MTLLHLAAARSASAGPPLKAVHVHHGLMPEADAWVGVCQSACDRLGVQLEVHRVAVEPAGEGLEAAARTARYRVFSDLIKAGDVLLLAHHADDQVETVLQRLLRGAGPRGLAGMPESRALGSGRLLRPLLRVSRVAIEKWGQDRNLDYVQDASNTDLRFDRSYLRREVLPKLAARWPAYRETVGRAAQLQAQWLDGDPAGPSRLRETVLGEPALDLGAHDRAESLATELHQWLTDLGWQSPRAKRLLEFARQCLEARWDRCPELVLDSAILRAWRGLVVLSAPAPDASVYPDTVVVGEPLEGSWGALGWQPAEEGIGFEPGTPLFLRPRANGELLRVRGSGGRDFGQLCQTAGIPPWWRGHLPVFLLGGEPAFFPVLGLLERPGSPALPGGDLLLPSWLPPQAAP